MHLHEAVRMVVEVVIAADEPVTERVLEDHIDAALAGQGLGEHGYRVEFRDLALAMLRFFLANRAEAVVEAPVAFSLNFGGEEIIVAADGRSAGAVGRRPRRAPRGSARGTCGRPIARMSARRR